MDDAWDEGYAAGLVDAETVADQERDDLARIVEDALVEHVKGLQRQDAHPA